MNETIAAEIHDASTALLADPGIQLEHEEIVARMLAAGAQAGNAPDIVRLPPEMIAEYLALAPAEVVLADRRGSGRKLTPTGPTSFWSCPGLHCYERGRHRLFTKADMARTARLLEQLGEVDVVFGMSMDDVPPLARDVVGLEVMARNCSKHIRAFCFSPAGAETMARMAGVVGPQPWFSIGFTAHGPLRWTRLALDIFARSAGHGIPTTINGEPMAGVSGPVTLAGSAAVGNAEILAGLVVNQLLEPGRPCIYNLGLAHVFDMRHAIAVTGAPENALLAKLSAVMGRFYNLPAASWASTESMCPDAQAGLEKMFGFHTHLESGVAAVWGVGQLESEMTFSAAQAVIDNEMIAYAKRFARGVATDADSLALAATREVGIAGSFLEHPHTAEHYRDELFMPELLWRRNREDWDRDGRKPLDERADDLADDLAARPIDAALTPDQAAELERLAQEFAEQA